MASRLLVKNWEFGALLLGAYLLHKNADPATALLLSGAEHDALVLRSTPVTRMACRKAWACMAGLRRPVEVPAFDLEVEFDGRVMTIEADSEGASEGEFVRVRFSPQRPALIHRVGEIRENVLFGFGLSLFLIVSATIALVLRFRD